MAKYIKILGSDSVDSENRHDSNIVKTSGICDNGLADHGCEQAKVKIGSEHSIGYFEALVYDDADVLFHEYSGDLDGSAEELVLYKHDTTSTVVGPLSLQLGPDRFNTGKISITIYGKADAEGCKGDVLPMDSGFGAMAGQYQSRTSGGGSFSVDVSIALVNQKSSI